MSKATDQAEYEALLASASANIEQTVHGLRKFHGKTFDPEVHEYIVRVFADSLIRVLHVAAQMHTDIPGSSHELHERILSELDKALHASDGEL